ncbi:MULTISPECIES: hypothetical protein [Bacillus]|uniref:hypothetical protein n=1 Tax=Bacillus TaxID=1386 RepID=UPI0003873578|nr:MULTISPECIES: hypothetical protein [Bacillus]MBU8886016.1 hypothetical protein [Bacillus sp. FJAT-27001]CDG29990.1 protein of unknown function [Bacillus velezensis UCMB5033]
MNIREFIDEQRKDEKFLGLRSKLRELIEHRRLELVEILGHKIDSLNQEQFMEFKDKFSELTAFKKKVSNDPFNISLNELGELLCFQKNKEGRYKTLEYVLSKTIDPYIDKPKQVSVISR